MNNVERAKQYLDQKYGVSPEEKKEESESNEYTDNTLKSYSYDNNIKRFNDYEKIINYFKIIKLGNNECLKLYKEPKKYLIKQDILLYKQIGSQSVYGIVFKCGNRNKKYGIIPKFTAKLQLKSNEFIKELKILKELTKIAIVHLYAQGITDGRLTGFQLELTTPSKIYEQEKVELYTAKVQLIQQMQQTKMFSKEWMYDAIMGMAKDEQDEQTLTILEDTKQAFRLQSIETQGVDPADQTGQEGQTNVEEEIQRIKNELAEDNGEAGRPKDPVRYGKDDHPMGRDPLGDKTLKRKEGYSTYNKYKMNYQEIFKDMDGNKKQIITS